VSSSTLYYGPGARKAALVEAHLRGRLLIPPVGDDGLKVGGDPRKPPGSREVVRLMGDTPVGMDIGYIIVGPMDRATPTASNALLKKVEESPEVVQLVLWAHDLGDVLPTIRSRCLAKWAPTLEEEENEELELDGRALLEAVLRDELWKIPIFVTKYNKTKKDPPNKPDLHDLLRVLADAISVSADPKAFAVWSRLRRDATYWNVTVMEVVAALLPEK